MRNHFLDSTYHDMGKWRCFTLTLLIFICSPISLMAGVVTITENPDWRKTLVKELEILSIDHRKITIDSLLQNPWQYHFAENNVEKKELGPDYWARCKLKLDGADQEWFTFTSDFWNYVDIYIIDSTGSRKILQVGLFQDHFTSTVLLSPQLTYDVYIKFHSNGHWRRETNISLNIRKSMHHLRLKGFTNYMDGIILGVMFGLAMYNLFLFFSIREKTYLWYSAYTLSIVIMFMSIYLDSPSHLYDYFMIKKAEVAFYVRKIFEILTWILYAQFARVFLNTRETMPTWDKLILILMIITGLGMISNYTNLSTLHVQLHFSVALVCSIAGAWRYIHGYKIARFFLIAQVFVVLGLLIVSGYYMHVDFFAFLPINQMSNYFRSPATLYACGAIESILFSFALGSKYNILQQDLTRIKVEKEQEKQALLKTQNEMLEQQVKQRTQELTQSLESLKTTQAQLIQAEKMASLGELTAGIAHEIQNPLNFINNFSSLNMELLSDTQEADSKNGRFESPEQLNEIIRKNSEKINTHGKRIDSIVKSMLEHSRSSTGKKEETQINLLCEETLKLAFHGFKAKEKTFNASYETQFEQNLPPALIIKQDLNRVLLNIVNNAFYAVHQRNKKEKEKVLTGNGNAEKTYAYQPKVRVATRSVSRWIEISVLDNGPGIPVSIRDKIFQPFFTTKPTGEGTGLGLSLAYDIMTKSMNGKILVNSVEDEYTEFTISIPIINV